MTLVAPTTESNENAVEGQTSEAAANQVEVANQLVMPADAAFNELVQLFKLLADHTRLRILSFLHQAGELNVRELCQLLRQRQPSVSHHLGLLREAGLIDMRRAGKHNFYRVIPPRLEQLITLYFDSSPGQPARICFDGFELRYVPSESVRAAL